MPCRVDPVYVDYGSQNSELKIVADDLEHSLDVAREAILKGKKPNLVKTLNKCEEFIYNNEYYLNRPESDFNCHEGKLPAFSLVDKFWELVDEARMYYREEWDLSAVNSKQVIHRGEDIKRLQKSFAENGEVGLLSKTISVDLNKPLKGQLGFDPHDY